MAVNWFEGGRRVVTLVQTVVAVGCIGYVVMTEPNDEITFETLSPEWPFELAKESCDYLNDARTSSERDGKSIELCFRGLKSEDGTYGIPYAKSDKPGMFWLGQEYSDPVQNYVKNRTSNFVATPALMTAGQKRADERWWSEKKDSLKSAFQFGVFTVFGLWLIATVLGWIFRGFAGIPAGSDFKSSKR